MKLDVRNKENKVTGTVVLPTRFTQPIRTDLIKRAVLVIQANKRQPYGAFTEAGKRPSVRISKRRHDYRGTYGIGQSRTPRKVMSVRGTRFNWQGAFAPQTVGGRRSHAPKASKIWDLKINTKERVQAINSALSAVMNKEAVKERGHHVPETYPFILDNDFETLTKTKEVIAALNNLGFTEELARADKKKVRAGKGKMRGRPYKRPTSILFVTAQETALSKAAKNIPGISITTTKEINAELLAPGTMPGRAVLFTQNAIAAFETAQQPTNNTTADTPSKMELTIKKKVVTKKASSSPKTTKTVKKTAEVRV